MSRILIADDNAQNRYMLEILLKHSGFDVESAENGAIALEMARKRLPDLIVTDVLMPVMDGFALCREAKHDANLAKVPLIFYTATYTEPKDQELGLSLGAERYIIKPQEPAALLEQIREVLANDQAQRHQEARVLDSELNLFRKHNAALFRKLEKKMHDLEAMNADLKAAREAAEQANRAKDLFLATLSHELRTPLTSILAWAQLLRRGLLDERKSIQAAESIEKSVLDQKRLVDDLLDVARITAGKLSLEAVPVNLTELISSQVEKNLPLAKDKSIELTSKLDPLPVNAILDPFRVRQVLDNLLKNALKFTPKGGRISVEMRDQGGSVAILVADNGVGLSPSVLAGIFDPFLQEENTSTTRIHGGLGIGLTIVKSLVTLMGGTVSAESPGKNLGTVFKVIIPHLPAARPLQAPVKTPTRVSTAELRGRRLVLVDDDPETLRSLTALFEGSGMRVEACPSASAGIAAILRQTPDVLISDIAMPGEDGYSLIKKLRGLQHSGQLKRFPAMALTAFADKETRDKALSAGFDACGLKPVDLDTLYGTVTSILRHNAEKAAS